MSTPPPTCLRCDGTPLAATDSANAPTLWSCPTCHHAYALDGDVLTDSRLGSLRVALYGVIFDRHPQPKAAAIVERLGHHDLDRIADAIELELASPSRPVHLLLSGMQATEADLLEYLGLVAAHIRTGRATED